MHESWCHVKPPLHQINDRMIDIGEAPNGYGGWSGKRANEPRKDEGTCRSKLKNLGIMGKWMETII